MAAPALVLRPYQIECVEELRRVFIGGRRAVLLQLPTGGGKTVILAEIVRLAVAKDHCVLVLVHRRQLICQTAAKLALAGVQHGIIAAGFTPNPEALVQVGSVHTLKRRPQALPNVDLIVMDEAHHARASLWHCLLSRYPGAWLLGVTATAARLDGRGLGVDDGGIFDAFVTGPSPRDLIFHGYLSPVRCYIPSRHLDSDWR